MSDSFHALQSGTATVASLASLDLLLSHAREQYCCIAATGSPFASFARANLPQEQVIEIEAEEELEDTLLVASPDLGQTLKEKGVHAFLPFCHVSKTLASWTQKHGLALIAPDPEIQQSLENKIYFDAFLRSHSLPVPDGRVLVSEEDIDHTLPFPGVLQVPASWGGLGTFFIASADQLRETIAKQMLSYPLLFRSFVPGIPVGMTMLIGEHRTVFSALRSQLFAPSKEPPALFLGVQWLANASIPARALSAAERAARMLSAELRALGFRGMANIDLILTKDQAFIIECNPRPSLCTCQLTQERELFHGLDFSKECLACFFEGDPSRDHMHIPESDFTGCVLDLDHIARTFAGRRIARLWEVGLYAQDTHGLHFATHDLSGASRDHVLVFHIMHPGTVLGPDTYMGIAMSSRPLADVTPQATNVTAEGKTLLRHLSGLITDHLAVS